MKLPLVVLHSHPESLFSFIVPPLSLSLSPRPKASRPQRQPRQIPRRFVLPTEGFRWKRALNPSSYGPLTTPDLEFKALREASLSTALSGYVSPFSLYPFSLS